MELQPQLIAYDPISLIEIFDWEIRVRNPGRWRLPALAVKVSRFCRGLKKEKPPRRAALVASVLLFTSGCVPGLERYEAHPIDSADQPATMFPDTQPLMGGWLSSR